MGRMHVCIPRVYKSNGSCAWAVPCVCVAQLDTWVGDVCVAMRVGAMRVGAMCVRSGRGVHCVLVCVCTFVCMCVCGGVGRWMTRGVGGVCGSASYATPPHLYIGERR